MGRCGGVSPSTRPHGKVSRVGGIFLRKRQSQNISVLFLVVMQYGGNVLVIGVFLFLGGNDFGGSGKTKIWYNCFGGNAIRRNVYGGKRFFVFPR